MIKLKKQNIYIIMYHYVREIKKSNYPNLKGLEFSQFKKQIDDLKYKFNILNNNDIIEILETKKFPKKESVLLTFDDGYSDHYNYVFPYLSEKKISGNFYPPTKVLENNFILDVNKIQFVLEKEKNTKKLLNTILKYISDFMEKDINDLNINSINTESRYDDKETIIIKRLLQNHIPIKIRKKIINKIFKLIVTDNDKDFAKNLYMNKNNILEMYQNNMTIGSHGVQHFWWEKLNIKDQKKEISDSIKFFKKINAYDKNFSVCFPYGSYNKDTLKILKKNKVKYALSTKVDSLKKSNINKYYELPRYDTNDFL